MEPFDRGEVSGVECFGEFEVATPGEHQFTDLDGTGIELSGSGRPNFQGESCGRTRQKFSDEFSRRVSGDRAMPNATLLEFPSEIRRRCFSCGDNGTWLAQGGVVQRNRLPAAQENDLRWVVFVQDISAPAAGGFSECVVEVGFAA